MWSSAVAQGLIARFVADQLRVQLAQASPAAERLMAETIAAYFLFSSSVTGTRKRQVVDMVLDPAGDSASPADGLVGRAFDNGIGGPGQAYNS